MTITEKDALILSQNAGARAVEIITASQDIDADSKSLVTAFADVLEQVSDILVANAERLVLTSNVERVVRQFPGARRVEGNESNTEDFKVEDPPVRTAAQETRTVEVYDNGSRQWVETSDVPSYVLDAVAATKGKRVFRNVNRKDQSVFWKHADGNSKDEIIKEPK
jgi:hypothetical protein